MTALYLIRHGRTAWNDTGRYQGQVDTPLNGQGRQQARQLAQALAEVPLEAIYSSDLRRARQTAQELASRSGRPLRFDRRLREIALGDWEGLTVAGIQARYPVLFSLWQAAPSEVSPPGGETLGQVQQRLVAALGSIAAAYPDGTVAVVTHGVSGAVVRCWVRGLPLDAMWEMLLANATWEVVEWPRAR